MKRLAIIGSLLVAGALGTAVWLHSRGPAGLGPAASPERSAAPARGTDYSAPATAPAMRPLRYDVEYPALAYSRTAPQDVVAKLAKEIADGKVTLTFDRKRGYLDAVLAALGIGKESQMLVFSRTSLQVEFIGARTPRAIYYGDDAYVAWVPGAGSLELAAVDPVLGPMFYTLAQDDADPPRFERQQETCLRCHDSYSLTGGGVPRLITGSGYVNARGDLVAHEGWILTSDETPLRFRWGGWYVTGEHGGQVHLGNIVVRDIEELQRLDEIRVGNRGTVTGLIDASPYLTDKSDIVALLVLEHQVRAQNALVRASYDARTALADAARDGAAELTSIAEPLVEALLLANEAELTAPIRGGAGFDAAFEAHGPRAADGRSLRELDLRTRLFKYPLSYTIYSPAFDALPAELRQVVYARLREVLSGRDDTGKYARLAGADGAAILAILTATKPEFADQ